VISNQRLFVIEAMKMESTIVAGEEEAITDTIVLNSGIMLNANDLVIKLKQT